MMKRIKLNWTTRVLAILTVISGSSVVAEIVKPSEGELTAYKELFKPALLDLSDQPRSAVDQAKVDLGRALYYDKRLSKDDTISCNSCHNLEAYGVDSQQFSPGVGGTLGGRNSPTSYNAYAHIAQFWDGRASTVEEQAKGPILNPVEMAMPSSDAVIAKLKGIEGYTEMFEKAFPESKDPVNYNHVGLAIGAFERNLTTPSRFDQFLNGSTSALTDLELKGSKVFVTKGCVTCHSGTLLGGQTYQKLGLVEAWPNSKDVGRFEVTGNEADKMMFKVPSLRNVEKTGPYFHDGSSDSLEDAVKKMAKHQLGQELSCEELDSLIAFLKSLTGTIPADYIAEPELPGASFGGFDSF
jgi:cytochrome c peroxidase